ncbi:hypothetical protein [Jiangella endophytica]|uniref:hypothetical protein n=1 Tax=Jiangella endophytica TaxID=1623398 RepID=UPI000E34C18F|nr:hypothetical protein [Jiangella endophytica]
MSNDDDGRMFDGYARLYGPLTVAALGLVFKPMFDDLRVDPETGGVASRFGNLWETASNTNGDPAVLGIILALIMMALCLTATFRPRSGGLPTGIAVVCLLIIVMLATKPGTGDPAPDLSPDGLASMAIAVFTLALSVVHAVHFARWRRERTASGHRL